VTAGWNVVICARATRGNLACPGRELWFSERRTVVTRTTQG